MKPVPYSGIASASYLSPDTHNSRVPYRYDTPANWRSYTKIILDPVTVYQGADNQFGTMRDDDRNALASYMQSTFTEKLGTRFQLVNEPGPGTLQVKLTLTGAKTTTPVLGTFTKFDIGGGMYNSVQAIRGKEGMMNGSVIYSVEIYDALSRQLLSAYITKQYPNAMNVGASFGALKAARVGIDKGANALVEQLSSDATPMDGITSH
ncbi:lipoprotein [Dyella acidisoli]|uniref:Lipoprotein n=1 Tax=Dyella acidisoli TaxID=1867834 RepID=A0ABQ5XPD6_9GAMM|nr:lipoprotein [Dyella acidisoli]